MALKKLQPVALGASGAGGCRGTSGVPGSSLGRVLGKVKMVWLPWEAKRISMERTGLTLMDTVMGDMVWMAGDPAM